MDDLFSIDYEGDNIAGVDEVEDLGDEGAYAHGCHATEVFGQKKLSQGKSHGEEHVEFLAGLVGEVSSHISFGPADTAAKHVHYKFWVLHN